MPEDLNKQPLKDNTVPASRSAQEQGDPPLTELRGFVDSSEDLEPTLTDGTKAPDKAEEENRRNQERNGS